MLPLAIAMSVLASASSQPSKVAMFSVHDLQGKAVAARVAHFDRTLRQAGLPGRVVTCSRVIDVSDARDPSAHNIGAICKIKFPARSGEYAICDNEPDDDGGQAALGLSWNDDRAWLINFTRNNCIEQAE